MVLAFIGLLLSALFIMGIKCFDIFSVSTLPLGFGLAGFLCVLSRFVLLFLFLMSKF